MDIFILQNGQQVGPFSEASARSLVQNGAAVLNDLAWREGMSQWEPLQAVIDLGGNPGEQVFLELGSVKVTNTRFVVGPNTYPMSQISFVQAAHAHGSQMPGLLLFAAAAIIIFFAINSIEQGNPGPSIAIAAAGVVVGYFGYRKLRELAETYSAIISTSAGQIAAYRSREKATVFSIVAALNKAIIARG